MQYIVVRKDKSILNLNDLYKHYNGNISFHIEHVVTGIDADFSIGVDAELKQVESTKDASLSVGDFEDGVFDFDLFFELDGGLAKYEQYLLKMYVGTLNETIVDEIQEKYLMEKAQKHCMMFFALLNPTFFLNLINQHENIQELIDVGAINIDFDVFVLEISINV